jgi:hypothetical protein
MFRTSLIKTPLPRVAHARFRGVPLLEENFACEILLQQCHGRFYAQALNAGMPATASLPCCIVALS